MSENHIEYKMTSKRVFRFLSETYLYSIGVIVCIGICCWYYFVRPKDLSFFQYAGIIAICIFCICVSIIPSFLLHFNYKKKSGSLKIVKTQNSLIFYNNEDQIRELPFSEIEQIKVVQVRSGWRSLSWSSFEYFEVLSNAGKIIIPCYVVTYDEIWGEFSNSWREMSKKRVDASTYWPPFLKTT